MFVQNSCYVAIFVWMLPLSINGLTPMISVFLDLIFLAGWLHPCTFCNPFQDWFACKHGNVCFSFRLIIYIYISLLNQGWVYLVEVIFAGTFLFWALRRMSLKRIHKLFIGVVVDLVAVSSLIPSLTSFFKDARLVWHKISATMAVSWSPNPGVGSQFLISPGQFVKNRLSVDFYKWWHRLLESDW